MDNLTIDYFTIDHAVPGYAGVPACYLVPHSQIVNSQIVNTYHVSIQENIYCAAGGVLTAMDGGEASLSRKGSVLAGTPRAVEEFHALTGI